MNAKCERLCVVMPVYNEEEAIITVLSKWTSMLNALGVDYELHAYNDGSTDNTLSLMRGFADRNSHVHIYDKKNSGHGPTLVLAYKNALNKNFDWIFQVDSDDEMSPEGFPSLWKLRNDYDFIVGRLED